MWKLYRRTIDGTWQTACDPKRSLSEALKLFRTRNYSVKEEGRIWQFFRTLHCRVIICPVWRLRKPIELIEKTFFSRNKANIPRNNANILRNNANVSRKNANVSRNYAIFSSNNANISRNNANVSRKSANISCNNTRMFRVIIRECFA